MTEYLLSEKYRPHTVEDTILPDRIKSIFQQYVNEGNIPTLLLSGPAGCGKTTIARAMCEQLGADHMFINASVENGVDLIRTKIKNYASTISLTGGRKVIILDEADYISPNGQAALRGSIEEYANNCSFIFTCNFKARLIEAIHSRCAVVDFSIKSSEKPKMAVQMLKRLMNILTNEGIDYDKAVLGKIVEQFFPDYRRTINELQRYSTGGSIDSGVLAQISGIRRFEDLVASLREKDFPAMRKWVANNSDVDPTTVYRDIYDGIDNYLKPESVAQAIIIIAKYQYQQAFVSDRELNFVACLLELMVECSFK